MNLKKNILLTVLLVLSFVCFSSNSVFAYNYGGQLAITGVGNGEISNEVQMENLGYRKITVGSLRLDADDSIQKLPDYDLAARFAMTDIKVEKMNDSATNEVTLKFPIPSNYDKFSTTFVINGEEYTPHSTSVGYAYYSLPLNYNQETDSYSLIANVHYKLYDATASVIDEVKITTPYLRINKVQEGIFTFLQAELDAAPGDKPIDVENNKSVFAARSVSDNRYYVKYELLIELDAEENPTGRRIYSESSLNANLNADEIIDTFVEGCLYEYVLGVAPAEGYSMPMGGPLLNLNNDTTFRVRSQGTTSEGFGANVVGATFTLNNKLQLDKKQSAPVVTPSTYTLDLTHGKTMELDFNSNENDAFHNILLNLVNKNKEVSYWKIKQDRTIDNDSQPMYAPEIKVNYNANTGKAVISLNVNEPKDGNVILPFMVNNNEVRITYGFIAEKITSVNLRGINFNYKAGANFSKFVIENPSYYVYLEGWDEVGGDETHIYNVMQWPGIDSSKFRTTFEANKEYKYRIWLKIKDDSDAIFADKVTITIDNVDYTSKKDLNDELNLSVTNVAVLNTTVPVTPPEEENKGTNKLNGIKPFVALEDSSVDFKLVPGATASISCKDSIFGEGMGLGFDNYGVGVTEGYDFSAFLVMDVPFVGTIDKDSVLVTVTIPTPIGYNSNLTRIVLDDKIYLPIGVTEGSVTFELPLIKHHDLFRFTGFIDFKKSEEEVKPVISTSSSVDNAATTTIVLEKELPTGSTLEVTEVSISSDIKKANKNIKKILDISIVDTNNQVVKVSNNKMDITIELDEDLKGFNTYKVVYIDDNGNIAEEFDATVVDGKLTFTTTHLSNYGIVAYNSLSPNTGDNIVIYIAVLVIALVSGAFVLINRKKLAKNN